jgi:hypothetical protein
MIDVAVLSDKQKFKLQQLLEMNKPMSYGIIEISIGHDPLAHVRSLISQSHS